MKKLLMIVAIGGFIAGTNAMAINAKCGDDKDKKCSKECKEKCKKEGKDCSKEKSCCKADAKDVKKACCKKGEKHEETKSTNEQGK